MKKIYLGTLFTFLSFGICENISAQNLCVYEDEETKNCLLLEEIENLTFSEEQVFLKKTDGTIDDFLISNVSKIKLEESITNIENISLPDKGVKTFPNPVEDILTIESTAEIEKILLFDMNGSLILQKETEGLVIMVQLAAIPAGIYNVQIVTTNGEYFNKIIKK